jgi:hypothetical protein
VRVCTQDASDVSYDAHVSVAPKFGSGSETFGEEYCGTSPYDVPWQIKDAGLYAARPGMFSVGHLPFYQNNDFRSIGDFPVVNAASRDSVQQGTRREFGADANDWGESCTHGDFLECQSDADCVPLDPTRQLQCVRGVCVIAYSGTDSRVCYDHSDCAATNQMCSGEGLCEEVVWQVENNIPAEEQVDNGVEFDLFSEECSGPGVQEYDMYGGSKWATIPDILPM